MGLSRKDIARLIDMGMFIIGYIILELYVNRKLLIINHIYSISYFKNTTSYGYHMFKGKHYF